MCWSDLLERKEFWALFGTVLGFTLNEASRIFREWREKRRLRLGIYDELEANLYQIEHKKDTARSMIKALERKEILPGMSVPCANMMYTSHFNTVIKNLKGIERDNIENVYSRLKIDDDFLNKFEENFRADFKAQFASDPWAAYKNKLEDILEDYEIAQELIRGLLKDKPVDIYYRKNPDKLKVGTFSGKVTPDIVRKEHEV